MAHPMHAAATFDRALPGSGPGAPRGFWREIGAVLAVKVLALGVLYFAFFSPAHRITVTPGTMAGVLTATPQAATKAETERAHDAP